MTYSKLNENNIQRGFLYNNVDGSYDYQTVSDTFTLDGVNQHQIGNLLAVDLGYTLDGASTSWSIKIDSVEFDIILISNITDLPSDLEDNKVYYVSDDVYLSSIVFINSKYIGSTFYYSIVTLNSTFSSFMLDNVAFKLNNFDVDEYTKLKSDVAKEITNREEADDELKTLITETAFDLTTKIETVETTVEEQNTKISGIESSVDSKITEEVTNREGADTELKTLIEINTNDITTLKNSIDNKQDILTAGAGITITDNEIKVDDTIVTETELTTKLNSKVDSSDYNSKVSELDSKITQEITDRTNKDTELEAGIVLLKQASNVGNCVNIKYKEYSDGQKDLTCKYTEINSKTLLANESYEQVIILPVITNVSFISITPNKPVFVYYKDNKIVYVNISGGELDISGTELLLNIKGN